MSRAARLRRESLWGCGAFRVSRAFSVIAASGGIGGNHELRAKIGRDADGPHSFKQP